MVDVPTRDELNAIVSIRDAVDNDILHRLGILELATKPKASLQDTFSTPYKLTAEGMKSPDGKWIVKYLSGGVIESVGGVMHMAPKAVTASGQTSAPQLNSIQSFNNFVLDLDMKTTKQLRTGSAPNTWEAMWIIIRFTNENPKSNHHYYFVIKTNGCEFGKKDNKEGNNTEEQQIFLATPTTPKLKLGVSNHVQISVQDYHFIIKVDGATVVDMIDKNVNYPDLMEGGFICLYGEDADGVFDNINVVES